MPKEKKLEYTIKMVTSKGELVTFPLMFWEASKAKDAAMEASESFGNAFLFAKRPNGGVKLGVAAYYLGIEAIFSYDDLYEVMGSKVLINRNLLELDK